MADITNQSSNQSVGDITATNPQSPVKKDKKMAKKKTSPRAKSSHPPTSQMVDGAINGLKERGGSSLQAIKKYMSATYKIDAERMAPFIRKYLKSAVESGTLIQTKGKGASGSFKLASASLKKPTEKVVKTTKKITISKTKVAAAKPQSSAGAKVKTAASTKKKPPSSPKKSTKRTAAANVKKSVIETLKQAPTATSKKRTGNISAVKAVAIDAATKTKSPVKARKSTRAGPIKKPKTPKPKTTKATAISPKAKKATATKKK